MAESAPPSKHDIQAIFKKLRSQQTNKQCFDCNSANPTWASVTYGVFLCIDCSATHRSLGVHLTFIRSTQLDTNWTWVQLRAMQCGGNANATAFFRQHGCNTKDTQQKYNSRAAALYKEKLHQSALHAQRLYGEKVHIDLTDRPASPTHNKKEEDFFSNHTTSFSSAGDPRSSPVPSRSAGTPPRVDSATLIAGTPPRVNSSTRIASLANDSPSGSLNVSVEDVGQPNAEAAYVSPKPAQPRKSTIGARKPAPKKGLGGKGLGATRVKTNFSEIESQIHKQEKSKEEEIKQMAVQEARNTEETEKQMANMRLAYKDIAADRKRHEDRLRAMDPKKAEQAERLGMGYGQNRGVSHSAMSDMTVISQDTPSTRSTQSDALLGRKPKTVLDDWEKVDAPSTTLYDDLGRRREPAAAPASSSESWDTWDAPSNSRGQSSDTNRETPSSFFNDELMTSKSKDDRRTERSRKPKPSSSDNHSADVDLHSKFGSAKSISSNQMFGEDRGAALAGNAAKFSGSASISSDDYFGTGRKPSTSYSGSLQTPDIQDIKDGVKQGVSKVAGKLSNLASGVMNSLQ